MTDQITTLTGAETMFGINFADGRIKGYPTGPMPGKRLLCHLRPQHGAYGQNNFSDNGLMWAQVGSGLNWEEDLARVKTQNDANYRGVFLLK